MLQIKMPKVLYPCKRYFDGKYSGIGWIIRHTMGIKGWDVEDVYLEELAKVLNCEFKTLIKFEKESDKCNNSNERKELLKEYSKTLNIELV